MGLLDKIKQKKDVEAVVVAKDIIEKLIAENKYDQSDSVATVLQKYENLRMMSEQPTEKGAKQKLHDAMLMFVNSIVLPTDKKDILDFLVQTMHYTRTSTLNDAVNIAADLSFKVAKTAGMLGKVATLGMASKVLDDAEKLTKKALTTNDTELATAWTLKIEALLKAAKKQHGGNMFGGDKEFRNQLDAIKKQLDKK